jgi:hypothetical protein
MIFAIPEKWVSKPDEVRAPPEVDTGDVLLIKLSSKIQFFTRTIDPGISEKLVAVKNTTGYIAKMSCKSHDI